MLSSTSSGSEMKATNNHNDLAESDVLAQEIIKRLEAALEQLREIAADLARMVLRAAIQP
jgi:hypothetical protein